VSTSSSPLAVAVARAGHVLPLCLCADARHDVGTKLGILRQLGGDIAQEGVAVARRDRLGGIHHGASTPREQEVGADVPSVTGKVYNDFKRMKESAPYSTVLHQNFGGSLVPICKTTLGPR
jgi:hypothetical protein